MKKLSRQEMKKVMGGNVKQTGCIVSCCLTGEGGNGCEQSNPYAVGTYSTPTCADGALLCTNGAGYVLGCRCFTGPVMP